MDEKKDHYKMRINELQTINTTSYYNKQMHEKKVLYIPILSVREKMCRI
jgi:hypothetical protein